MRRVAVWLLVLAAALSGAASHAGPDQDQEGGEELAALCAVIDCEAIAKRVTEELKKEALCIQLSSECPGSGVGRCKDIHGKMQSMNGSASWKQDFFESTQSKRTRCYARSILERGGGNWEDFLQGLGLTPQHRWWSKYRNAAGK